MATKPLEGLAEEFRSSPELTPYPESFARCVREIAEGNANGVQGETRSTAFVTASGFVIMPNGLRGQRDESPA